MTDHATDHEIAELNYWTGVTSAGVTAKAAGMPSRGEPIIPFSLPEQDLSQLVMQQAQELNEMKQQLKRRRRC